ncbi:MAG: NlpC/P60 family protein [Ancalomicrobiaceae bacterium]|nr:NlpC/P60 family protein [Ancalomicrobiaceae bacterium]
MSHTGDGDLLSKVLLEAEKKLKQDYLGATDDNCAHFVRDCFRDAGYVLPETKHPSDLLICQKNGYALGPLYANSLAGDEIGRKLTVDKAEPGDIVLFSNLGASSTSFAKGTITHVGICVGNHMMIDHGSSGMHKRDYQQWPGSANYAEARRPKLFDIPTTRIQLADGKIVLSFRNTKVHSLDVLINLATSGLEGTVRHGLTQLHILHVGGGLDVVVDGVPLYHYRAVWLRVYDLITHTKYALSYQHGHAAASANGMPIGDLKCRMTAGHGGLHVHINGKEVRTADAKVEIVYPS